MLESGRLYLFRDRPGFKLRKLAIPACVRAVFAAAFGALMLIVATGSHVTDEETGASYYVFDGDTSSYGVGAEVQSGPGGGYFKFESAREDSRDDILLDETIAQQINRDSKGNPIAFRVLRGDPARKEVALTFDDGPHPEYYAQILAILQHYRVHATFFMVGFQATRHPQWVKQVWQAGNEIGNHTYDHFRLTKLPPDEVDYQINQTQDAIYQITGSYPRFIRPPGGRYDADTLARIADKKLAVALWSYNTKDVDVSDTDQIYKGVMSNLQNGSILLMHSGSDATVKALPKIIESIKARGYKIVTLGQMVEHMSQSALNQQSAEKNFEYEDWRIKSG